MRFPFPGFAAALFFISSTAIAQAPTSPPAVDVLTAFAKVGDIEAVDNMIANGIDVDGKDSEGNTALQEALENSHFDVAIHLIEHGVKSAPDFEPEMSEAILRGNIKVVKALLAHGVSVDKNYQPAIEQAASVDGVDMVQLLLAHGAKINRQDVLGKNAVVAAAEAGNEPVLRYLLAHGADARVAPIDGDTPLTAAITHGRLDLVPLLLARGADVRAVNQDGYDALDLVDPKWHPVTYPLLTEAWTKFPNAQRHRLGKHTPSPVWSHDPSEAIVTAAMNGDLEATTALLAHHADPTVRDVNDNTVLYYALRSRSLPVVKALLDHGVSIEEREPAHETPLCVAATFDELDIVKFLLERGAKVDPGDVVYPPIDIAAYAGDTAVVKLMIEHGGDDNEKDANGETALWYAADFDDPSMAKLLLDHGAKVDIADPATGDTPLIRAARHGRRLIVSMLLAHGASATTPNLAGQSALDVAGDGYHPGTLAQLRAASQSQSAEAAFNRRGFPKGAAAT